MKLKGESSEKHQFDVSVIIPNFNCEERFLRESFDSLINQTFPGFECIVVDDSDNLQLADFCQKLCKRDSRFRYIRNRERLGLAASLNVGLSLARGKFIARFDSDDICVFDRIQRQKIFLENNPDIGVVGSWIQIIDRKGCYTHVRRYSESHSEIDADFVYKNAMAHPTVMFRRDFVESGMLYYREEYRCSEDLELWLRLLAKGVKFGNIPICLVLYRQQLTDRSIDNWKFNVRARLDHFSSPKIVLKILCISILAIWAYTPKRLQRTIYAFILLRER